MPRVLCVWFPDWPLQRLRTSRTEPARSEIVVFAARNNRPLIRACSPQAQRSGLRIGQPLAEARALLPKAVYLPSDSAADRDALRQLALDSQRFSPLVGLEEDAHPESLLADVTGCTHLWDGEKTFLDAVARYWRDRNFQVRIALAGSVGAAWALAHASNISLIPPGNEQLILSSFPVEALRLFPECLESLHALGLHTIGSVLSLPRETLASRFGVILPQRLSQALGDIPETFVCERLEEPLTTCRESEVPIEDRFAIAFLCRQMLRELLVKAERLGVGLHECQGELRTETDTVKLELKLVEPTRDLEHLAQLVDLQLERLTWSGGVIAIRWNATRLASIQQAQASWFSIETESKNVRAFNNLVERLSSRLEPDSVLRAEIMPEAQPEHAARLLPWTNANSPQHAPFHLPAELSRNRPFRLLDPAEMIDVTSLDENGPPLRMLWKGQTHLVTRAWGPERIATGWWRVEDIERDYYRAEWDDGTHVWVYHDLRVNRWFLHGFFD
jgi:protein ImuB